MAEVSCNFERCFENILLQDTITEQTLYLITDAVTFKKEVSYYKILLLISVSEYYLQDTKVRYYPSLLVTILVQSIISLPILSNCFTDAVVRTSYYKYFLPKEAFVPNGVLNR